MNSSMTTSGIMVADPKIVAPTSTMRPASNDPVCAISAPIATGERAPTMFPMPLKTPTPDATARAGRIWSDSANNGGSAEPQKKALTAMRRAAVWASDTTDTAYIATPAENRPPRQMMARRPILSRFSSTTRGCRVACKVCDRIT